MLLGILAAFVLLGYMCMKGWSVYISAPLCAIIIALTSGMGPLSAITESFLPGTGNYLAQWFGLFMLGALFGKIMETSGAAASIAHSVTKLIGAGNACIAVILATSLMTYGGISLFVVVFVMYPFAVSLFQDADLPKRLPAALPPARSATPRWPCPAPRRTRTFSQRPISARRRPQLQFSV